MDYREIFNEEALSETYGYYDATVNLEMMGLTVPEEMKEQMTGQQVLDILMRDFEDCNLPCRWIEKRVIADMTYLILHSADKDGETVHKTLECPMTVTPKDVINGFSFDFGWKDTESYLAELEGIYRGLHDPYEAPVTEEDDELLQDLIGASNIGADTLGEAFDCLCYGGYEVEARDLMAEGRPDVPLNELHMHKGSTIGITVTHKGKKVSEFAIHPRRAAGYTLRSIIKTIFDDINEEYDCEMTQCPDGDRLCAKKELDALRKLGIDALTLWDAIEALEEKGYGFEFSGDLTGKNPFNKAVLSDGDRHKTVVTTDMGDTIYRLAITECANDDGWV